MADYKFYGNYKSNLIYRTITFGSALRKDLERYGISKMFFVKDKEKYRNIIKAYPELPPGKEGIPAVVEEGRFRIPKKSIKEFIGYIEYAGLKPGKVTMIGIDANPSFIEIWNTDKIVRTTPPLSDKNMEQVSYFLTEENRKKLQIH